MGDELVFDPHGGMAASHLPSLEDDTIKLSLINGLINNLSSEELSAELARLHLHDSGNKRVKTRRLKQHVKEIRTRAQRGASTARDDHAASDSSARQPFELVCVMDFEATCEEERSPFPHEIIEIPAILLDAKSGELLDTFQTYVRPKLNPQLSKFCTNLTGITQDQVDAAKLFPEAWQDFEDFLGKAVQKFKASHDVDDVRVLCASDGPWDFRDFLAFQCQLSQMDYPAVCQQWMDVRKRLTKHFKLKWAGPERAAYATGLDFMLQAVGLTFEGRPHSGIDDSRNIARLVQVLIDEGAQLSVTHDYNLSNCQIDLNLAKA
ncbi:uncharacterized protein MONBRDRAFT_25291 [Monosiga brevicollis MX1]|uniref:Exonuclease domain-containing protein n=1 Tax=Monosiga brevicollis TaxID=81824 RepID=A9UYZ2_MONBE|nr:uncharacterized protein MONBRDRAFT_25291 [Monosiga brevicollis MX1]EDQ89693.1 predicted protein [Monosiga brevicollis MX1]|eukprot:XP_001745722.1 hypothetical protein [Monosiga brevicollis MX1]